MAANEKRRLNVIAGLMLFLVPAVVAVFWGCQDPLFQSSGNKAGPGEYVDEETGDVFLNGLNKTYMEENNLTEADLLAVIKASNEADGLSGGGRGTADDSDLFYIMTHFTDYFTIKLNEYKDLNGNTTGIQLQVGLDTNLLTEPLHDLCRVVKDTRYNWQEISRFSIEKIENQFVYLKGRLHVKAWTELPFNQLLKIADKEADIKVKLELLTVEEINKVGYAYEITDVSIDRQWYEIFLAALGVIHPGFGLVPVIINDVHRAVVKGKILDDGRGSYYVELGDYIDPEYLVVKPVTSSGSWVYINFEATQRCLDVIDVFLANLLGQHETRLEKFIYRLKKVYVSSDAMISNVVSNGVDYSNRNYGDYQYIQASSWTYQQRQGDNRSLMIFNTASLPPNIVSAKLYLFGVGGHDPLTQSNACYLQVVTSAWSESGVTWNNQPSVTTASRKPIGKLTSPTANAVVNITDWAIRWKLESMPKIGLKNYGMMLRLQNEVYYAKMQFASSEYSTSSKRPYLLVQYYTATVYETLPASN
ncbi:MAG: DNRLRE domain-containing protein [Spirochaetales bacterium]|nr:DNRLRE domain-containing protein [Spirochaetales bacterium]